jgi:hypothetical protein
MSDLGPAPAPPTRAYPTQCRAAPRSARPAARPARVTSTVFGSNQLVRDVRGGNGEIWPRRGGSDRRCCTYPSPVKGIANEHLHRRIYRRQFVLYLHQPDLAKALIRLAPDDLSFVEIPIGNLPLYSQDYDADYPPEGRALKEAIAAADAILFVTPEYNRSIPGALKNAIDWASRPWGQNSFDHVPAAVIGASPGSIGTALGQQSLRAVLSYANARQMTAPEA